MSEPTKPLSRSEREAQVKDKAGWVISLIALLLGINTYIGNGMSGTVLQNTIKANDTWSFYQAKSIKQTIAEGQLEDAIERGDTKRADELTKKIARYESDPVSGEGKKELSEKARGLEIERDNIRKQSPWLTFAGTAYQFSLVLLTASILAVSMPLFYASLAISSVGILLMSQGIWLWIPL